MLDMKYKAARVKFWIKFKKVNDERLEIYKKIALEKDVFKLEKLGEKLAKCNMILRKCEKLVDEKEFIKAVDKGVI